MYLARCKRFTSTRLIRIHNNDLEIEMNFIRFMLIAIFCMRLKAQESDMEWFISQLGQVFLFLVVVLSHTCTGKVNGVIGSARSRLPRDGEHQIIFAHLKPSRSLTISFTALYVEGCQQSTKHGLGPAQSTHGCYLLSSHASDSDVSRHGPSVRFSVA